MIVGGPIEDLLSPSLRSDDTSGLEKSEVVAHQGGAQPEPFADRADRLRLLEANPDDFQPADIPEQAKEICQLGQPVIGNCLDHHCLVLRFGDLSRYHIAYDFEAGPVRMTCPPGVRTPVSLDPWRAALERHPT